MSHPHSPDNPERIARNIERYTKLLSDERPASSEQLRAAFLSSMEGKEYGTYETLDAFDWFWDGWAKSSGARSARPEVVQQGEEIDRLIQWHDRMSVMIGTNEHDRNFHRKAINALRSIPSPRGTK